MTTNTMIYGLQDRVSELEYEIAKHKQALIDIEVLIEKEPLPTLLSELKKVLRNAR